MNNPLQGLIELNSSEVEKMALLKIQKNRKLVEDFDALFEKDIEDYKRKLKSSFFKRIFWDTDLSMSVYSYHHKFDLISVNDIKMNWFDAEKLRANIRELQNIVSMAKAATTIYLTNHMWTILT